ncbi:MAG: GNAT family N-acetyltransferase [Blastocatellia bacterium]
MQAAEDAWNTRDPEIVAQAYSEDSEWRNRTEFFTGREAIKEFLRRSGAGTPLLRTMLAWTRRSGHEEVTLTTFRAVPWNMPFYSQHGFEEIHADELRAELKSVVRDEAERSLDLFPTATFPQAS